VRLGNRAGLAPDRLAALAAELPVLETLAEVVRWGASLDPATVVRDVVIQDEFTHDVVLPWRDGLVLVFGTT